LASLDAHHRNTKHSHTYFDLVDQDNDGFISEAEQWAAVQAESSGERHNTHLAPLYNALAEEQAKDGRKMPPSEPEGIPSIIYDKPADARAKAQAKQPQQQQEQKPEQQPVSQPKPSSFIEKANIINFEYPSCSNMVHNHCSHNANGNSGCCQHVKKRGCFHAPQHNAHWGCCWPWDSQHLWCRTSPSCIHQGCPWTWLSIASGASSRQFGVGSKHYCDCPEGGTGVYPFGRPVCSYGWAGSDCATCSPYWGYECATAGAQPQCGWGVNLMCGDDINPDTNTMVSANGANECDNEQFTLFLSTECNSGPVD
jgi:hypothetical protein